MEEGDEFSMNVNNEIVSSIREARNRCSVKMQRFCEEVARSIPASAAYRNAGYRAKTAGTAEASASKLLRNPKVAAYLSALRDADTGSAILSRRERLEELTQITRNARKDKAYSPAVGAIRELNKMTDEYRAESINVTSDVTLFETITGKRRRK